MKALVQQPVADPEGGQSLPQRGHAPKLMTVWRKAVVVTQCFGITWAIVYRCDLSTVICSFQTNIRYDNKCCACDNN